MARLPRVACREIARTIRPALCRAGKDRSNPNGLCVHRKNSNSSRLTGRRMERAANRQWRLKPPQPHTAPGNSMRRCRAFVARLAQTALKSRYSQQEVQEQDIPSVLHSYPVWQSTPTDVNSTTAQTQCLSESIHFIPIHPCKYPLNLLRPIFHPVPSHLPLRVLRGLRGENIETPANIVPGPSRNPR